MEREDWLLEAWRQANGVIGYGMRDAPEFRVSFPRRSGRSVRLWDVGETDDGAPVVMISPAVSTTEEVLTILGYVRIRSVYGRMDRLAAGRAPTTRERSALATWGYDEPYTRVVPTAAWLTYMERWRERLDGPYPEGSAVLLDGSHPAPRQTTRMLKILCNGHEGGSHDPYVARMSQRQINRGLPFCPVCWDRGFTTRMVTEG